MSAQTARNVQSVSPYEAKKLDYGGNQMLKQEAAAKAQEEELAAQQRSDAAGAGNMDTRNASTRSASLQYSADSAGATRSGNSADTVSGTSVMTKKKQASRDLGVS